ncbi:dhal domain-containing protein, partial [Obelidium mucronatum]
DLEINAFQKHVLLYIRDTYPSLASLRVITGRLMTSLQMHGLSLTLLVDATEEMLELLDAQPDNIGQWPGVVRVQLDQWKSTPSSAVGENCVPPSLADHAKVLKECIRIAAETMIASEERLTEFDTVAGDGDCGHTVKAGGLAILGVLDKLPFSHPASTLISISAVLETTMGGSSGVLYCIMLDAAAGFLSSCSNVSPESWAISLEKGLEAIIKYGGAKPGDRTMIDALHPLGAKATESMQTARAGRSSYIGAYAVAAWVSAVISFLKQ